MSSNKPQDWNKWLVVYHGGDGGTDFLSQSQHDTFVKSIEAGSHSCVLKDGRVLPIMGARIIPNPDYVDPERSKKVRELVQKNWEKLKAKQRALGSYYNPYDEK